MPEGYFESDSGPVVQWEPLNEAWEVYWYEHQKLNAKPFPVKKYGAEAAKKEAFAFLDELKSKGRFCDQKPHHLSSIEGVKWDEKLACWVALCAKGGRPRSRSFSAELHGFENAKFLAESYVKD